MADMDFACSYTPSFVLCVLGIVLFAISCGVHILQLVRLKTWYLSPVALACFLETMGYIFRSLSSKNDPYHIIWFVVQYFMIVVAPVFISAGIYVCINKLIAWAKSCGYKASHWWLAPKFVLWGFVTVDIFTTILQIAGAALVGSSQSNQKGKSVQGILILFDILRKVFQLNAWSEDVDTAITNRSDHRQ